MKLKWNVLIQTLATILQGANAVSGMLPPRWQLGVAVAVGAFQGIVAGVAHHSNPDGSPAQLPWKP